MKIATFNVENLFTRYRFTRGTDPTEAARDGFTTEDLRFRIADPVAKQITGQAINAVEADIWALQEVESLDVLKQFRDRHLGGREAFPHAIVIDGNDDRRIDVAILSRFPLVHLRSWQHLQSPDRDAPIFDRDCLEADVDIPGHGTLTLYVNHFKSMRDDGSAKPRATTRDRRFLQAKTVRELVTARFPDPEHANFVILGDLNDRHEDDEDGPSGLGPLLDWNAVENVVDRLPQDDRWTHHYKGSRRHNARARHQQLDYVLPSRGLARLNPGLPTIERRGLPKRSGADVATFPGVGKDRPKASDHCPVVFELNELCP